MRAFLVLENGKVFEGKWRGRPSHTRGVGEVVFNTGMAGYQEILSDPSYYQQIMVMTAPQQGNYGVIAGERESRQVWVQGFVCLELSDQAPPGRRSLLEELNEFDVPILTGVDTRALTLELRSQGTLWGCIVETRDEQEAIQKANATIQGRRKILDPDWVHHVSTREKQVIPGNPSKRARVAVLDFGSKENIIRELSSRAREVVLFPSRATARQVLDYNPHGIMLTNGPGDPVDVKAAVDTVRDLLGTRPLFGICMGHQILGLALGAKTYKLKFGHRGINHPVQDLHSKEIYMTSQNHGYCIDEKTLPTGVRLSQINLYDKTCEGIEASSRSAWSVQYHPEAAPGPNDANVLFDRFIDGLNVS